MDFTVIPAIDIMDGSVVRLSEGDFYRKTTYTAAPLEAARRFEDLGFSRIHVVDLDGARCGHVINYRSLERIALNTGLSIQFGGGIQTGSDIDIAFASGAAAVIAGTAAVDDPPLFRQWLNTYSGRNVILAADVRHDEVAVRGWTVSSGRGAGEVVGEYIDDGLQTVICTDITRDGLLNGPSLDRYRGLTAQFPDLRIIASGGVGSLRDIEAAAAAGCSGVIVGKALYENRISDLSLKRLLQKQGDPLCRQNG
ncbi:1-(5-phosphoribosyl)-5-[(5-phosphoribosylamino)methylideneamino] imidazole-4-carboxamide isomerase [bacterium]|nr:1-(5-phosphoribosyl)-5-[(5-phosphoribosylamino)methylideneamino] imidazole-4-carboxamide isomerase [bacterium]